MEPKHQTSDDLAGVDGGDLPGQLVVRHPTASEHLHVRATITPRPPSTAHPAPEAWSVSEAERLPEAPAIKFRPLTASDRGGLKKLTQELSPESRYRRYLSPKVELAERELTYLTDIDHVHHEAIAAVDQRDQSIVGVARYAAQSQQSTTAEVAFEVADRLQNQGIGTALTEAVIARARANHFSVLTATTLWENQPARALLRRLGFRTRVSHGREIELQRVLEPLA